MSKNHSTDQSEIWKLIPSFSLYEASTLGRIRRLAFAGKNTGGSKIGDILTPVIHTSGYAFYCLRKAKFPGKRFNAYGHVLIAEAFFGKKPKTKKKTIEVNHKNGIKNDNRIENLEYVTSSENQKHAFNIGLQQGRKGESHHGAKLTEKDIKNIRSLKAPLSQKTCKEMAAKYHVHFRTIQSIFFRRSWKHVK